MLSINLGNITSLKKVGNARIRTQDSWVHKRKRYHCAMLPPNFAGTFHSYSCILSLLRLLISFCNFYSHNFFLTLFIHCSSYKNYHFFSLLSRSLFHFLTPSISPSLQPSLSFSKFAYLWYPSVLLGYNVFLLSLRSTLLLILTFPSQMNFLLFFVYSDWNSYFFFLSYFLSFSIPPLANIFA